MAFTDAQLKAEIDTDSTGLGLVALRDAGNAQGIADALTLPRAGITVRRADISPQEVIEAVLVADYTALPGTPTATQLSTERRYLGWLSTLGGLQYNVRLLNADGTDGPVIANLNAMFPGGSGTRTRVLALTTVTPASRAEQLWGHRTRLAHGDVSRALELGG